MKFLLILHVYALLPSLALVGSHAVSPEVYWNSVLPYSPIPKAIKDLLYNKGFIGLQYGASKDQQKDKNYLKELNDQTNDGFSWIQYEKDNVKDGSQQLHVNATSDKQLKDQIDGGFSWLQYVKDNGKDRPQRLHVNDTSEKQLKDQIDGGFSWLQYKKDNVKHRPQQLYVNDTSEKQLLTNDQNLNPLVKLLFLEHNLRQGEELKLEFLKNQKAILLPKVISDSLPFSSKNLSEIYDTFSIKPDSMEAQTMKVTLGLCERIQDIKGDDIFCATSLEPMIDFVTKKLGKWVKALSTELNAKESTPSQMFKLESVRKLGPNNGIVCHRQSYAYAIFTCHTSPSTLSYIISLAGEDGTKVKSVAVCHLDTSKWSPKLMAFKVLKVAPGTVPICHFLSEDNVLWVPY